MDVFLHNNSWALGRIHNVYKRFSGGTMLCCKYTVGFPLIREVLSSLFVAIGKRDARPRPHAPPPPHSNRTVAGLSLRRPFDRNLVGQQGPLPTTFRLARMRTPWPKAQSQSFFRSYTSSLPTSLTFFLVFDESLFN